MVVDEEGLFKETSKVNMLASLLYGDTIVGDVLFVAEDYTDDGIDLFGLTDIEAKNLVNNLKSFVMEI